MFPLIMWRRCSKARPGDTVEFDGAAKLVAVANCSFSEVSLGELRCLRSGADPDLSAEIRRNASSGKPLSASSGRPSSSASVEGGGGYAAELEVAGGAVPPA